MKTSTKVILIVLVWILVPLFFLAVSGFIAADFNPFNWVMEGRFLLVFISIIIAVLLTAFIYMED